MHSTKVAQLVDVLNGLTARDALCLLVGGMLTLLDETPSDEGGYEMPREGAFVYLHRDVQ